MENTKEILDDTRGVISLQINGQNVKELRRVRDNAVVWSGADGGGKRKYFYSTDISKGIEDRLIAKFLTKSLILVARRDSSISNEIIADTYALYDINKKSYLFSTRITNYPEVNYFVNAFYDEDVQRVYIVRKNDSRTCIDDIDAKTGNIITSSSMFNDGDNIFAMFNGVQVVYVRKPVYGIFVGVYDKYKRTITEMSGKDLGYEYESLILKYCLRDNKLFLAYQNKLKWIDIETKQVNTTSEIGFFSLFPDIENNNYLYGYYNGNINQYIVYRDRVRKLLSYSYSLDNKKDPFGNRMGTPTDSTIYYKGKIYSISLVKNCYVMSIYDTLTNQTKFKVTGANEALFNENGFCVLNYSFKNEFPFNQKLYAIEPLDTYDELTNIY